MGIRQFVARVKYVAVTVTVVVPTGKMLPLAGAYVSVGVPMLSVAVAPPNVTVAPLAEVASTVNKPGTVKTGGVVSNTAPADRVPVPEPSARLRARRKPVWL